MQNKDYFKLENQNKNNNIFPYVTQDSHNNAKPYLYSLSHNISPIISRKTEPEDNIKKSIALKRGKLKDNNKIIERIIKNKIFVLSKEKKSQTGFNKNRSIHFGKLALLNININNTNVNIDSNKILHTDMDFYHKKNLYTSTNITIPINIIKKSNSDDQINFYISNENNNLKTNLKSKLNKSCVTEKDNNIFKKIINDNMIINQSPLKNEKIPLDTVRHNIRREIRTNIKNYLNKNEEYNKTFSSIQTSSIRFLSKNLEKLDTNIIQKSIYNNNYIHNSNNLYNLINNNGYNDKKELKASCLSTNDNTNSKKYSKKLERIKSENIKNVNKKKNILTLNNKEDHENEVDDNFNQETSVNKEINSNNNENKKNEKIKDPNNNIKSILENNQNNSEKEFKQNNNTIELIPDSTYNNNFIYSSVNAELKTRPKILTDNETIKEKEISKNKKAIDIANKKIIKKNLIKKPKGKEEILEEVINLKGISKTKEIPDQIKSIYPIKKLSNISTMDSNYFIINDKKTIIITKENRKHNSTDKNNSKITKIENKIFNINSTNKDVNFIQKLGLNIFPNNKSNEQPQKKNDKNTEYFNENNCNNIITKNDEENTLKINGNNSSQCIVPSLKELFKENIHYNKSIIIQKNFDTSKKKNKLKKAIEMKNSNESQKNMLKNNAIKSKTHYKLKDSIISNEHNNDIGFQKSYSNMDINNEINNEIRDEFSSIQHQNLINLKNKLSSYISTFTKLKKRNNILINSHISPENKNSKESINEQKKISVQEFNKNLINKIRKRQLEIQKINNLIKEMKKSLVNYDADISKYDQLIEKEEIEGDRLRYLINFLMAKK